MDAALLQKIAASYGASNSAENMNRIREFYANDPTAGERRAYGAKGQSGEGMMDRTMADGMLDKIMAKTDVPASIEQQTLPDITQRALKGPSTGGAPITKQFPQDDPSGRTRPMTESGATDNIGKPAGPGNAPNLYNGDVNGVYQPDGSVPDSMSLWPLIGGTLAALLGTRGTAGARAAGSGVGAAVGASPAISGPPNVPQLTYSPKLEGQVGAPLIEDAGGPKMRSGAPAIPQGAPQSAARAAQSPADIARMEAEVAAENAGADAIKQQMLSRQNAQNSTRDLLNAGRKLRTPSR